jgi:hypothetical protein
MGVDASPRSVTPSERETNPLASRLLMGQRLREAITHGVPPRNPDTFLSRSYALREIDGLPFSHQKPCSSL